MHCSKINLDEGENWPGGKNGQNMMMDCERYYKKKNIRMKGGKVARGGGKFWPKGEMRCKRYYEMKTIVMRKQWPKGRKNGLGQFFSAEKNGQGEWPVTPYSGTIDPDFILMDDNTHVSSTSTCRQQQWR